MTWTLPSARTLVMAAVAAVIVLAAAAGGWYWYDTQQRRVAAAYAEVMTRAWAAQSPQAASDARVRAQQDLERVLAEHPSGAGGAEAAYELGNLRYAAQQYAQARGAYELAVARASSPTVRTLARSAIGYTWEAERDFKKAIEAYQGLLQTLSPKDFLWEQTHLDLARAQELAGQRAEAIATYQKLLKETPSSPRLEEARAQLARLGASTTK